MPSAVTRFNHKDIPVNSEEEMSVLDARKTLIWMGKTRAAILKIVKNSLFQRTTAVAAMVRHLSQSTL